MDKKRKSFLLIGGTGTLVILFFAVWFFINNQNNTEIPVLLNSTALSEPVKEQISEAVKKASQNPSATNLGELGMIYHSSANYQQAEECYELAINKSQSDWIWNYYNGYLNMEMGDSEGAIENFNRVIQKNPEIKLSWYYIGGEYKNLGNDQMAEKSYMEISNVFNTDFKTNSASRRDHFPLGTYAGFELARIYFNTGRTDEAKLKLEEIIQKNYLFGPAYRLLGSVYNTNGDKESGEKYTIRANDFIAFSPPVDTLIDKLVLLSRSELYLLKKIDEAERSVYSDWALQIVDHGLKYLPDNGYMISKAINIFLWKKMNENAIALVEKHFDLFIDNFAELKNTGMLFFRKGLNSQAVKYWTRALEIKPDDFVIQENLAKSLWATGKKQQSLELLDEIVDKNPDNTEFLADVADLLFQFGSKEKANTLLTKLKKIEPSNPKLLRMTAQIALENKDIPKSISLFEESFNADPKDVKTIRNLGDIYKYRQMWDKYIRLYSKALVYNPNSPDYLARLGEVYISCPDTLLRNFEKGKEYAERAFTYYDCPPDILIATGSQLAYAYARLGDMQRAIVTISQTINIGRSQNISADEQKRLETLYLAFKNLAN